MPLYLVTIQVTAVAADVAPAMTRHGAHLDGLVRDGRLRVAGAFARDEGLVEIFEAVDRKQAEATVRAHPLVEAGVAAWSLRELRALHGLDG